MAIYVFVTDSAKEDCKRHGMDAHILERFAERIENSQQLEVFERNNPHPILVKKKFYGHDRRLIALQKHVETDTIIVILRILIRGSNEYTDHFEGKASSETTIGYIDRQYKAATNDDMIREFVAKRNVIAPPKPLPDVSSTELEFLWSEAYPGVEDDIMVCETHEFVQDIRQPQLRTQLIRIPDMVVKAVSGHADELSVVVSDQNTGLRLLAYNSPKTNQCVLLRLFQGSPDLLEKAINDWKQKITNQEHSTILRFCRVSYPSLVCGDEQIWVSLHSENDDTDSVANLSLSPEEGDILTSCDRHDGENAGFPLFINGRAGSGKSTLLQYLFAFSFRRWLLTLGTDGNLQSCPLYLASSGTLLDVAHRAASNILTMNSSQVLEGHQLNVKSQAALAQCFKQTTGFMHWLLPPEDAKNFPFANRVDYAAFRRLWDEQFRNEPKARREYGPQVSWHVIRGLIKGFSSSELLEESEYETLPRDEKSVSRDTFRNVYNRVWFNWYREKCNTENLWDDQDLARYLIDKNLLPRTHVAIFCDEAQDFTRVELDAIYQCSLFSNRSIESQSISRIPFVFAGDPFQTLNPTGFRWESVQAAFTERLLASLHRFSPFTKLPELHYEELTFNYRSAKRIVHLCNTIQASRALLFDYGSLRPQETWRLQDSQNAPAFLDVSDIQIKESLREQKDLVLIIPCEEGEETEYVASDPFLKEIVDLDDDGIPLNVQSAARSKGLEFKRVGLYGWSRRAEARRIAELLKSIEIPSVDTDEKLQLEYFMNNLYVAASRAQRRLFIIDEGQSRDGLWWIVDDEEHLQKLTQSLSESWKDHIGSMVTGGADSFQHDKDTNKRRAEQQKAEGLAKRSSFTLRQAARYFELDGNTIESNRCRGFAYRFAKRHVDSARHFEDAGDFEDAVRSLWEGSRFSDVAKLAERCPSVADLPECVLSLFICEAGNTVDECIETLNRILDATKNNSCYARAIGERTWAAGIERALSKILGDTHKPVSGPKADMIVDSLQELIDHGLEVGRETQAKLNLAAGNFEQVVELLRDDVSSPLYQDAFALRALGEVGSGQSITETDAEIVGEYFLRLTPPNFQSAADYFYRAKSVTRQLDCLEAACVSESIENPSLAKVIETTLQAVLEHRDWANLVAIVSGWRPLGAAGMDTPKKYKRQVEDRILKIISDNKFLWRVVLPFLASSDGLANDTGQQRIQVQKLLKNLVSNQAWRKFVSPNLMGAAIERAGKDIDALIFYEDLMRSESDARIRKYAQIRWVVCKLRQAKRQNSNANRQEAQRVMDKYQWDDDVVREEYPANIDGSLTPVSSDSEQETARAVRAVTLLADRERVTVGQLEFTYLEARGWINIESSEGLRARVLIGEVSVESNDVEIQKRDANTYIFHDLGLQVQWQDGGTVNLMHDGQLLQVVGSGNRPSG
jgi:hypothetical protein